MQALDATEPSPVSPISAGGVARKKPGDGPVAIDVFDSGRVAKSWRNREEIMAVGQAI
jgi:hypothetical protein